MKWLILAGITILPLIGSMALLPRRAETAAKLPHLIVGAATGQPASAAAFSTIPAEAVK